MLEFVEIMMEVILKVIGIRFFLVISAFIGSVFRFVRAEFFVEVVYEMVFFVWSSYSIFFFVVFVLAILLLILKVFFSLILLIELIVNRDLLCVRF